MPALFGRPAALGLVLALGACSSSSTKDPIPPRASAVARPAHTAQPEATTKAWTESPFALPAIPATVVDDARDVLIAGAKTYVAVGAGLFLVEGDALHAAGCLPDVPADEAGSRIDRLYGDPVRFARVAIPKVGSAWYALEASRATWRGPLVSTTADDRPALDAAVPTGWLVMAQKPGARVVDTTSFDLGRSRPWPLRAPGCLPGFVDDLASTPEGDVFGACKGGVAQWPRGLPFGRFEKIDIPRGEAAAGEAASRIVAFSRTSVYLVTRGTEHVEIRAYDGKRWATTLEALPGRLLAAARAGDELVVVHGDPAAKLLVSRSQSRTKWSSVALPSVDATSVDLAVAAGGDLIVVAGTTLIRVPPEGTPVAFELKKHARPLADARRVYLVEDDGGVLAWPGLGLGDVPRISAGSKDHPACAPSAH